MTTQGEHGATTLPAPAYLVEVEAPLVAPRITRRTAWVTIPDDAYAGCQVKLWLNPPHQLALDIDSGDAARVAPALRRVVLEHNGWLDFDGEPYPAISAGDAFWDAIPDELAALTIVVFVREMRTLPNWLSAKLSN